MRFPPEFKTKWRETLAFNWSSKIPESPFKELLESSG